MKRHARRGFTLAEIAVALAVVAMGVVTIFLMVPQGIRTQTLVRYKVIAAAKAQEVVNILRQTQPGMAFDGRDLDKEGVFPWDTQMAYKSMAPDLEPMLENLRGTIKPLPEEIARRLESDNDEIRELINSGGRLYYFYPGLPAQGLESVRSSPMDLNWLDGARKLVMGVLGPPQQNSILYHASVKIGPYQDFYPSPPTHGRQSIMEQGFYDDDMFSTSSRTWVNDICYDALARDPAIADVYTAMKAFTSVAGQSTTADKSGTHPAEALAYFEAAVEYALAKGFTINDGSDTDLTLLDVKLALYEHAPRPIVATQAPATWPPTGYTPPGTYTPVWPPAYHDFVINNSTAANWERVLAMRFLGHAGMVLTAHYEADLGGGAPTGVSATVDVDTDGDGVPDSTDTLTVQLEHIRAWNEAAVQMGIRHADQAGPYHWAAPRPLNRQVMMDHPLVQLDLTNPVIERDFAFQASGGASNTTYPLGYSSGLGTDFPPYVNSNTVTRQQWRAVYGRTPQTPMLSDRPWMYPGRALDVDGDGDIDEDDRNLPGPSGPNIENAVSPSSQFNLTAPFDPRERCRQLVFWAVDWQSYVDFESAPSAAIDGSRYPIAAPAPNESSPHTDPMDWSNDYVTNTDYRRQINAVMGVSALSNSVRNPELIYLFCAPSRAYDATTGEFTGEFYSNSNNTNIGQLQDDIPIMSEINIWLDPAFYSSKDETLWGGLGVRLIDMRSERDQDMPSSVENDYYGHDENKFNMMMFLGRYGANRDGRYNGEWVNWKQIFGQSAGSSYKNVARVNQGSIPASVRLRATTVARFNFYDPRVSGGMMQ